MHAQVPIFIDANIYLNFYDFSDDDLEELHKLVAVLEAGEAVLLVTQQVKDEFARNRENKVARAIASLDKDKVPNTYPHLCKDYPEYKEARRHQREFQEARAKLVERVTKEAIGRTLKADELIRELFGLATMVPAGDEVIEHARLRVERGNPPGKRGSLGDAIHWEALLAYAHKRELHFVTADGDFGSPIKGLAFSRFLENEWSICQPKTRLVPYERLSEFFAQNFPQIKLISEAEKDLLISQLERSGDFRQTHRVIAKLEPFADFTDDQARSILGAFLDNSQVNRLVCDDDVYGFIRRVMEGRIKLVPLEKLATLYEHLARYKHAEAADES